MHSPISPNTLPILTLLFLLLVPRSFTQTCYRPDGEADSSDYQPCNKGKVSMCCATNRTNNFLNICRSDGLCIESGTQANPGANTLWREGCTDPTWRDPACIRLCADGFAQNFLTDLQRTNMTTTHMVIYTCPDGSLCCGEGNTACCNAGQGVWLQNGVVYSTNPNATNTSTSSTTSPTSTSSSSPSSSASKSSGGSSAVGIGVGVSLGVVALALIALGAFFYKRKRKQRREGVAALANGHDEPSQGEGHPQPEQYSELSGQPSMATRPLVEKDSGQHSFVAELPGHQTDTGYRPVPQLP